MEDKKREQARRDADEMNISESEIACSENCSETSHFLRWVNGETEEEEVQVVRGMVPAFQHDAEGLRPGVCLGGGEGG